MQKVYAGSLALTKLKHALTVSKTGKKLLILPIEDNFLEEKDGAIYMATNTIVRDEVDQYGQHGFISQKLPTAKYKELGELAKDINLPILGNIKNFASQSGDNAGQDQTLIEELNADEADFDSF
jgi:hypothetical protein